MKSGASIGKRYPRCAALALALTLALTGCGAGEEPVPTATPTPSPTPTPVVEELEFALPCYTQAGFHPITGGNRTNLTLAPLMFEGLYELNASFEVTPLLCQAGAVSEDGLTWTFTVKPEAAFSDGSPVTAAEVEIGRAHV